MAFTTPLSAKEQDILDGKPFKIGRQNYIMRSYTSIGIGATEEYQIVVDQINIIEKPQNPKVFKLLKDYCIDNDDINIDAVVMMLADIYEKVNTTESLLEEWEAQAEDAQAEEEYITAVLVGGTNSGDLVNVPHSIPPKLTIYHQREAYHIKYSAPNLLIYTRAGVSDQEILNALLNNWGK